MKTLALVSLAGMVGACSSNYMPRSRGRVAVMMQNGVPTYVRDGQPHPHGWFGSGLTEAVAGNRLAEQAAAEYHDRLVDGVLMTTVGALCMPTALTYALVEGEEGGSLSRSSAEIVGGVAIGCTVLLIAGAAYAATAEPYRWDAINLFNDGADFGPPTASAQLLPRTAPPKASLEMR
jgi:hypothetical protein